MFEALRGNNNESFSSNPFKQDGYFTSYIEYKEVACNTLNKKHQSASKMNTKTTFFLIPNRKLPT